MIRIAHGVIHGRAIELREDLGLADGQLVEIQVTMIGAKKLPPPPPPGWRPDKPAVTAGLLADFDNEEEDRKLGAIGDERNGLTGSVETTAPSRRSG